MTSNSCICPPTQDWCDCPTWSTPFKTFISVGIFVWLLVFLALAIWYMRRRRRITRERGNVLVVTANVNSSFSPPLNRHDPEEILPLYTPTDARLPKDDPPPSYHQAFP